MHKIILITQGLSRVVLPIYEHPEIEIVGIVESAPRNNVNNRVINKYYLLRNYYSSPLRKFCLKKNIPFIFIKKCSLDFKEWIENLKPDLIVVYSMSFLLKEYIYNIPKYGTINLHQSLLPKYRGPNSVFWSYYNFDLKGGVTVHYIDQGEDTGDILLQGHYDVPLGIRSPDRFDIEISKIGVNLLIRAIINIETIKSYPQQVHSSTPRARNIQSSEYKDIVKWEKWSKDRIFHLLRGTEQWLDVLPSPKGIYYGTRWNIDRLSERTFDAELGSIVKNSGYHIVCKDGSIDISKHINISQTLKSILKLIIDFIFLR